MIDVVLGREILDSRGNPTLEVEVYLQDGTRGRASVPSGASTGAREAVELRDGDKDRYFGKGVQNAVRHVNEVIGPEIEGEDPLDQLSLDALLLDLDDTDNKGRLGANAILGVSMATSRAAAKFLEIPLYQYLGGVFTPSMPAPMLNVINGGAHADNSVNIQEFMLVPGGASSFVEALRWSAEIYHTLKALLKEKGFSTSIGDEGGFAPNLESDREALELLTLAIERAGYKPGSEVALAIDVAASTPWDAEKERYAMGKEAWNRDQLISFYEKLTKDFPLVSIEDGLHEDDWEGWSMLNDALGHSIQLVADDLVVTNPRWMSQALDQNACNAFLIKPNQIGTVSETFQAIHIAHRNACTSVISHRSGETEDTFIADLTVAAGSGFIKTGAPCRGERVAKYNRLIRIEEELPMAGYAGWDAMGVVNPWVETEENDF